MSISYSLEIENVYADEIGPRDLIGYRAIVRNRDNGQIHAIHECTGHARTSPEFVARYAMEREIDNGNGMLAYVRRVGSREYAEYLRVGNFACVADAAVAQFKSEQLMRDHGIAMPAID